MRHVDEVLGDPRLLEDGLEGGQVRAGPVEAPLEELAPAGGEVVDVRGDPIVEHHRDVVLDRRVGDDLLLALQILLGRRRNFFGDLVQRGRLDLLGVLE